MDVETTSLPLDARQMAGFGREIKGVDLGNLTEDQFSVVHGLLYEHGVLLFRNCHLTPEQQFALTKRFDPSSFDFGHGNNKVDNSKQSILHSAIKAIPSVPQVQLIGNGTIFDHEGFPEVTLKHPTHKAFHKACLSETDEADGLTRFVRWHMDAALYDLSPPRVTTLYGLKVPQGPKQSVSYDDGTGDTLEVPLGATAFSWGKVTFDVLPPELKSVAVRTRVKYAPHPYVWVGPAKSFSTGLGIESEGKEVPYGELPPWEESKIKIYPMLWKNPITGNLHLQVHPWCVAELYVDPLPAEAKREGALYAQGAHLTDLKEVRELLYQLQRPGIAPQVVYPHDWHENDLIIFHNRGILHSVTGNLREDQIRVYHQCNLAATDEPLGPDEEDVRRWA